MEYTFLSREIDQNKRGQERRVRKCQKEDMKEEKEKKKN